MKLDKALTILISNKLHGTLSTKKIMFQVSEIETCKQATTMNIGCLSLLTFDLKAVKNAYIA